MGRTAIARNARMEIASQSPGAVYQRRVPAGGSGGVESGNWVDTGMLMDSSSQSERREEATARNMSCGQRAMSYASCQVTGVNRVTRRAGAWAVAGPALPG